MVDYLDVEEARSRPGLRLVLTQGVPGPWSEAAKGLFHIKKIPYLPVRQEGGGANEALLEWTGQANAPLAVLDDEPPRGGSFDLIFLAERLAPTPSLVPRAARTRAEMFGLLHEIAGEGGLGWSRRLMMLDLGLSLPLEDDHPVRATMLRLGGRYGYSKQAAAAASDRVVEVLDLLAEQLRGQRERGAEYLVGDAPSALDVYWATFAALLDPLPPELCPMSEPMRQNYTVTDASIRAALDSTLLAHRDRIYRELLVLPLEF
jgi:glutathione S-transferase